MGPPRRAQSLDESETVAALYRAILNRNPDPAGVEHHVRDLRETGFERVLRSFLGSVESQTQTRPGPLWNYTATFDPVRTVLAHENHARRPVPGHRVNYLGVAVNVTRFAPDLRLANVVEPAPIPNNWHTDLAEMGAALRAVERSGDSFVMAELGCGWGCWMAISAAAARLAGKTAFAIGVEADEGHLDFAREAMATNAIAPSEYRLVAGIAAARTGTAFFPIQERAGLHWGLKPVFDAAPAQVEVLRQSGDYREMKTVALDEAIGDHSRIDLLHVDIQGGEGELLRNSIDVLNRKVGYIVVGTHSRMIDGEIIGLLQADGGWRLEIERPTLFTIHDGEFVTRIDGVQGWRNARF